MNRAPELTLACAERVSAAARVWRRVGVRVRSSNRWRETRQWIPAPAGHCTSQEVATVRWAACVLDHWAVKSLAVRGGIFVRVVREIFVRCPQTETPGPHCAALTAWLSPPDPFSTLRSFICSCCSRRFCSCTCRCASASADAAAPNFASFEGPVPSRILSISLIAISRSVSHSFRTLSELARGTVPTLSPPAAGEEPAGGVETCRVVFDSSLDQQLKRLLGAPKPWAGSGPGDGKVAAMATWARIPGAGSSARWSSQVLQPAARISSAQTQSPCKDKTRVGDTCIVDKDRVLVFSDKCVGLHQIVRVAVRSC